VNRLFVLCLILSLSLPSGVFAATQDTVQSFGGGGNDTFRDVLATNDGGFISVGFSSSSSGDVPGNYGNFDFLISRFDSNGNKIWTKNYGGSSEDRLMAVTKTNDGNYMAAGYSRSNNYDIPGNNGVHDLILFKFDKDGNKIWIKNYGNGNSNFLSSISSTNDGGFIVSGNDEGSYTYTDAFVMKFDSNGNIQWSRSYSGSMYDNIDKVIQISSGEYVFVGYSSSNDGSFSGHRGTGDAIIGKLDGSGNTIWLKSYGGTQFDRLHSVHETSNGELIALGTSGSSNGDLAQNNGNYDFLYAKFDTNGNILKMTNSGGSSADRIYSSYMNQDGSIVAVGYSQSNSKGSYDLSLLRYDNTGNHLWTRTYGGTGEDILYGVTKIGHGRYASVGYSSSNNYDIAVNKGYDDTLFVLSTIPVSSDTKVSLSIQSGGFSLSGVVSNVLFGNILYDSTVHIIHSSLSNLTITDNRGTLAGWNVLVSATPFISKSDPSIALGSDSLKFGGISTILPIVGNSISPTTFISNPVTIDSGSVKILGVASGSGSGTYEVAFPTNALTLFVDTSKPLNINDSTIFESTITWTLSTGP